MASGKCPARPCVRPPTEAESRLARESSRRLGRPLADEHSSRALDELAAQAQSLGMGY